MIGKLLPDFIINILFAPSPVNWAIEADKTSVNIVSETVRLLSDLILVLAINSSPTIFPAAVIFPVLPILPEAVKLPLFIKGPILVRVLLPLIVD